MMAQLLMKTTMKLFKYFFIPKYFFLLTQWLLPTLYTIAVIMISYGAYLGLVSVPADITQGEVFRIIYIHVPLAVLSLLLFLCVSICMLLKRGLHLKMAGVYASACAIVGLLMTALTIVTGMIWAKPTWGVWWVWDARLTSEAILAALYAGFIIVRTHIRPITVADEISGYIAWIGAMNIPLVHYSVNWWFTLHQGASVLQFAQPKMPWIMLYPLIMTGSGFLFLAMGMVIHTVQCSLHSVRVHHNRQDIEAVVERM